MEADAEPGGAATGRQEPDHSPEMKAIIQRACRLTREGRIEWRTGEPENSRYAVIGGFTLTVDENGPHVSLIVHGQAGEHLASADTASSPELGDRLRELRDSAAENADRTKPKLQQLLGIMHDPYFSARNQAEEKNRGNKPKRANPIARLLRAADEANRKAAEPGRGRNEETERMERASSSARARQPGE